MSVTISNNEWLALQFESLASGLETDSVRTGEAKYHHAAGRYRCMAWHIRDSGIEVVVGTTFPKWKKLETLAINKPPSFWHPMSS